VPELPEVETVRRNVERELVGKRIATYSLSLPKLLRGSPIPTFDPIIGRDVRAARRRAKVLIIDFSGDLSLMVHFKLAGQFAIVLPDGRRAVAGHPVPDFNGPLPHKTTHFKIHFADGTVVFYSDVRQLGWIRLLATADTAAALLAFGFGPEAVGDDRIAMSELRDRLRRRSIPLKLALLDQSVLAGLGNIYVDEALHRAGIHPARVASSLDDGELSRVYDAIAWALEMGIEQGGAKIIHNRAYPVGGFPEVHARGGEPCPVCRTPIVKIRVGARGTYLCPVCQPVAMAVTA
jgi:formamidopyrimidine-DNA glycosylase